MVENGGVCVWAIRKEDIGPPGGIIFSKSHIAKLIANPSRYSYVISISNIR